MVINVAIRFEPDGYLTDGPRLMGRQSAGAGFLRAAVAGLNGETLACYTPTRKSYESFSSIVARLDSRTPTTWIPTDRLDLLSRIGALYLPGPDIGNTARLRLHSDPRDFSIVGITHTTASHAALDAIADQIVAPVMPWDALICTSTAVAETVRIVLQDEMEYLKWRAGISSQPLLPALPVIPLGIHSGDFTITDRQRNVSRQTLGIGSNDIVVLYVGRLSFHAKAHPHALYVALEEASSRTRRRFVLVQCGWFANDLIQSAFTEGAETFAPNVRTIFMDGRKPDSLRRSWEIADIFISLSDNIQETFGLTPLEAMSAGLPVIVSDWDGYKDTVRNSIDGFRIPTWMPASSAGIDFARRHEAGIDNYDRYCGLTAQTISVEMHALIDAITQLATNDELRITMGNSGQNHARQYYDWSAIFDKYQILLRELESRRMLATKSNNLSPIIKNSPRRPDPYRAFGHYATHTIEPDTKILRLPGCDSKRIETLRNNLLWRHTADDLPPTTIICHMIDTLDECPTNIAARIGLPVTTVIRTLAVLAKMGLVILSPPSSD